MIINLVFYVFLALAFAFLIVASAFLVRAFTKKKETFENETTENTISNEEAAENEEADEEATNEEATNEEDINEEDINEEDTDIEYPDNTKGNIDVKKDKDIPPSQYEGITPAMNKSYNIPSFFRIPESSYEYINCIGLERASTGGDDILKRAPCWSYNSKGNTIEDVVKNIIIACSTIGIKNGNRIKGPVYFVIGRNRGIIKPPQPKEDRLSSIGGFARQEESIIEIPSKLEAWAYMPSLYKDGSETKTMVDYYSFHSWIRKLMFSGTFGVNHWFCNNPCDIDIYPDKKERKRLAKSNRFTPSCGCISKDTPCRFYYVPKKTSMGSRKPDKTNTYSVYKIKAEAFSQLGIILDAPVHIDMDSLNSGFTMYSVCDSRLISKNMEYSFELDKTGASFYRAKPGTYIKEGCSDIPNSKESDKNSKILLQKYKTTGVQPRLINTEDDLAIYTIIDNPDEKGKKTIEKEWILKTEGKSPFTIFLDNTGTLKSIDQSGTVYDVMFMKV